MGQVSGGNYRVLMTHRLSTVHSTHTIHHILPTARLKQDGYNSVKPHFDVSFNLRFRSMTS